MRRQCPVNHCANRPPAGALMCGRCWKSLPEALRCRVMRAYWDWKEAARGRYGTAESIAIEIALHHAHAIAVREDAVNAAGFSRRDYPIPPQLLRRGAAIEQVAA